MFPIDFLLDKISFFFFINQREYVISIFKIVENVVSREF